MKPFLLACAVGALSAKEVEDGRCPMQPGEVPSKVASNLDYYKIQGPWINLFDEKDLADQFLCMSAKFVQFDESKHNELSFQQANSLYEVTRQHLRETEDAEIADQKYFINAGRKVVFNYPNDKSVGKVETTYV